MRLNDFLKARMGADGPWNCSTMPADWCIALGYPDFAAAWREITDPAACEAEASAGLAILWDRGIGDGLRSTDDPDARDIAVIAVGEREFGAIFTGERWAVQGGRALHFLSPGQVRLVEAWRP